MLKIKIILVFIVVSSVFLRFWRISEIPPSLSHDEVAIGYNAWSILQTGKDEYGTKFPLLFRSFDDYKPSGYIYTTALSEKIFGFNEFAVRFPSAFLGSMTVLVLYFLLKELFSSKSDFSSFKYNSLKEWQNLIPIIASFMLAISPWHINFSRAAFETNGSVFFLVLGLLFLFKGLRRPWFFCIALTSFVVSIYFYYTPRILVPAILIVFFLIFKKELFNLKKWFAFSFLIGFILLIPLLPHMFSTGLSRVNQVSIFEDKSLTNPYSEAIVRNNNSTFSKIMYNRRMAFIQEFFDNYFKNFAPDYLFTNGAGQMGLLYLWEVPFFAYGIFLVFKSKIKSKWIILIWFFTVPIVGGLTMKQPNALRTLSNVIPVTIFSSFGLYGFFQLINKTRYFKIFAASFILVVIFFFIRFLTIYFDYNAYLTADSWGDGHKQMGEFISQNKNKYDNIYITGDYWRPYIYVLFYTKYSPKDYQKSGSRYKIDNMYFGQAEWDKGAGIDLSRADLSSLIKGNTLFILSGRDFSNQKNLSQGEKRPYGLRIIKEISGSIAKNTFYVVKLDQ